MSPKPMEISAANQAALIYPVKNYNFGSKAAKLEKDHSTQERLLRMEDKCARCLHAAVSPY